MSARASPPFSQDLVKRWLLAAVHMEKTLRSLLDWFVMEYERPIGPCIFKVHLTADDRYERILAISLQLLEDIVQVKRITLFESEINVPNLRTWTYQDAFLHMRNLNDRFSTLTQLLDPWLTHDAQMKVIAQRFDSRERKLFADKVNILRDRCGKLYTAIYRDGTTQVAQFSL